MLRSRSDPKIYAGLFDHPAHEWLMRMLAERIDDEPFLRLTRNGSRPERWTQMGKC